MRGDAGARSSSAAGVSAPVAVIGLGAMGRALAAAFLAAGRPVTVWNRTAARADELVERGAVRAASPAEALAAAPLVVVCLLDHATMREVLAPAAAGLRGRTLVNLTNGSPAGAAEMAAWVGGHGGEYLDGGIMAVPTTVATPGAFVLYSGERRIFDAHREALAELGDARHLGEDIGLAALHDLALLGAMNLMFDGFHHAVALATSRKEGSAVGVTELLVPWLTSMLGLLPAFAAEVDAELATGEEPRLIQGLDVQFAALANIMAASREAGVSTAPLEPGLTALRALRAEGRDTWSAPASVRLLREAPPDRSRPTLRTPSAREVTVDPR
ncbi:NAD(P)-binding domain-containing protein [Streptomyces radicis]|uniref:NAD(P)-dependent oxidoreductase n=1 Tax=Streptomyces radicis TaxID=1750517 RepID=A0A3A9WXE7_9ACTN|nr:NAD(P)-binding domain-containing protein [Streptomyces radicis]RKN10847.1 NAD(P)-dependent oxidoreductase [Streptomyces radicis]RKN25111.1 NAD(P)-dependent oxidoreductase [Streptomyces radicis]